MCHHHKAAVVSGDSLSQELGILGGSQMVTPWGCSLRLRRRACLPDVKSHGQHPGDPQRMVTFIPPTHPDLMVSTGPSVKLAWRRCRLRQSGKACHMVSHAAKLPPGSLEAGPTPKGS